MRRFDGHNISSRRKKWRTHYKRRVFVLPRCARCAARVPAQGGIYLGEITLRKVWRRVPRTMRHMTTPVIRLDSGQIIFGIACLWTTQLTPR